MKRLKRLKVLLFLALFLVAGILSGCGSGSGGGPNPSEGSTWDQMEWDKGKWG